MTPVERSRVRTKEYVRYGMTHLNVNVHKITTEVLVKVRKCLVKHKNHVVFYTTTCLLPQNKTFAKLVLYRKNTVMVGMCVKDLCKARKNLNIVST